MTDLPKGLTLEGFFNKHRLTKTERVVFLEVARGKSDLEIAEGMFVQRTTTKYHVSNILKKLGLKRRTQMMLQAYKLGVRP